MKYLKRIIDFLAVPFICFGAIAALIFTAIMAGWVTILDWYYILSSKVYDD